MKTEVITLERGTSPAAENDTPLFPDAGKNPNTAVKGIKLERKTPAPEYIGLIEATADEDYIKQHFGPGTYQLTLINKMSQPLKGGIRTLTIAEDVTNAGKKSMDLEMKAYQNATRIEIEAYQARIREERELRTQERKEREDERKAELERIKQESMLRIQEAEAKAERERKEAESRAERERKEQDAKAERERKLMEERYEHQRRIDRESSADQMKFIQASNAQMIQLITNILPKQGDAKELVTILKEGIQTGSQLAQGPQLDPGVEIAKTIGGAIGDMRALGAGAKEQAKGKNPAVPAEFAGVLEKIPKKTKAFLAKALQVKQGIEAAGQDPEEILEGILQGEMTLIDKQDAEEFARYQALKAQKQQQLELKNDHHPAAVQSGKPADSRTKSQAVVAGDSARHRKPGTSPARRSRGRPKSNPAKKAGPDRSGPAAVGAEQHHVSAGEPGDVRERTENAAMEDRGL